MIFLLPTLGNPLYHWCFIFVAVLPRIFVFVLLGLPVSAVAGSDEADQPGESLDDLAKELSNPVSAISYFGIDIEYRTIDGE